MREFSSTGTNTIPGELRDLQDHKPAVLRDPRGNMGENRASHVQNPLSYFLGPYSPLIVLSFI